MKYTTKEAAKVAKNLHTKISYLNSKLEKKSAKIAELLKRNLELEKELERAWQTGNTAVELHQKAIKEMKPKNFFDRFLDNIFKN